MVIKWSLKYVASKSILCFISINTKNTSYLCKKIKFKILSFISFLYNCFQGTLVLSCFNFSYHICCLQRSSRGQNHIFIFVPCPFRNVPTKPNFQLDVKFQFFLRNVLYRPSFNETIVESQIFKQFCMFLLSLCWSLGFFFSFLITNIDPVIAGHLSK